MKHFSLNGWPKHFSDDELMPNFLRNTELTVESDCVMSSFCVVIPAVFRPQLSDMTCLLNRNLLQRLCISIAGHIDLGREYIPILHRKESKTF